jgi:hypothetical protein
VLVTELSMLVEDATLRELGRLGDVAAESPLAASALVLARRMDDGGTADTAMPALARELREALARLADLEPARARDKFDELEAKRLMRRATG